MLLTRSSDDHPLTVCVLLVVCLCIFMQMLGTTMTLWDLDFDPVNAALLEGFSLPASSVGVPPPAMIEFLSDLTTHWRRAESGQTRFRPPNVRI